MKRFFCSPITWITFALSALIVSLYLLGFRITYAPMLDSKWEAISAVAGWFSAFMSAGALIAAIRIPKVIAEQQNKIALFDKRYAAVDSLLFLISVVKQIVDGTVKEMNKKTYFDTIVETYNSISIVRGITSNCKKPSDAYVRLIMEAGKIGYLFDVKEIADILDFLKITDQYISDVYKGKHVDDILLIEAYNRLSSVKIQEKLEAQLKI